MQPPEALYIHLPFCLRKCPYCDFYSAADAEHLVLPYVEALLAELEHARCEAEAATLDTIYLGGGTPTLLPPREIARIIDACRQAFDVSADAEVTVECNPGTVDGAALADLRACGVTRLSLGVQSLVAADLEFLGRAHSVDEAREAALEAATAGFEVLSFDLIYCLPGQSPQDWRAALAAVLELEPDHISAYCLQVEPDTPLGERVERGETVPLPEDDQAALYGLTAEVLSAAGLEQYEVSNYAVAGAECRHNQAYWRNEPYLGLGAGAWSFIRGERRQNVPDVAAYVAAWSAGQPCIAYSERCEGAAAANETLLMGLRTREGISLSGFRERHGVALEAVREPEIGRLATGGLVALDGDRLSVTPRGMALVGEVTEVLALAEKDWPG